MCIRIDCYNCGKPTWIGCGNHIETVLAGVPYEKRCKCRGEPKTQAPAPEPEPVAPVEAPAPTPAPAPVVAELFQLPASYEAQVAKEPVAAAAPVPSYPSYSSYYDFLLKF